MCALYHVCVHMYVQREVLLLKLFTKMHLKQTVKELKINYKWKWSHQSVVCKHKEPVNSNDYTGC